MLSAGGRNRAGTVPKTFSTFRMYVHTARSPPPESTVTHRSYCDTMDFVAYNDASLRWGRPNGAPPVLSTTRRPCVLQ
ncbi:hypothetical protein GCM10009853_011460 [Glycomyces scopariae]